MTLIDYLKLAIPVGALGLAMQSHARPDAPAIYCDVFKTTTTCSTPITCTQCHSEPPILNVYGESIKNILHATPSYSASTFTSLLPEALTTANTLDSDGDGELNNAEISQGTHPADANSNSQQTNNDLQWDPSYALHKVMLLFCGHSPRYEQKRNFLAASNKAEAVHTQLTQCLNSDYWKHEALHRLADKRIRPLYELGLDGVLGIADYQWDYRLFSHALTNDNDARDLLLANYHVDTDGNLITAVIPRERPVVDPETGVLNLGSGQPLITEKRVGMISTQWFLAYFTMFAELPRNTASQAYRAYLGLDIAKSEGLMPVEGEPRDVDNKGVDAPQCAACHSTLDPLAYAFSAYAGIEDYASNTLFGGNPYGTYYPEGTQWENDSYLFGQPVVDLKDWAQQAANSDAFKQNLTHIFFTYATGQKPSPANQEEFKALWQSIDADNYSANKLIHRLIDTLAFGGK